MNQFPQIRTGVVTGLPFEKQRSYLTTNVVMPCGLQYSWKWRDNPKRTYILNFTAITEAEATTLENFFKQQKGKQIAFEFTDPDDTSVYVMRFDQDDFELKYLGPNECSVTLRLQEVPT